MDYFAQMAYEIKRIKSQLENMQRIGNVTKIYPAEGLVDVAHDNLIIERIPFLTRRAGDDLTYWMPSVGEQGMLLAPSGDLNNVVFIPGIYSNLIPAPEDHEKWTTRQWKDGTKESYDKDAHEYVLRLNGDTHRKVNREELQDKRGDTEMNMDGTEAELKNAQGHFKVNADEAEVVFGAAKVELSATRIRLTLGASIVTLNAAGIILQSPIVDVNAPVFNWNGVPTNLGAWTVA